MVNAGCQISSRRREQVRFSFSRSRPRVPGIPLLPGGSHFGPGNGRQLFYNPAAGQIAVVGITTRPFALGEPTRLPGGTSGLLSRNPASDPRVWDITGNGKLIGITDAGDTAASGTPAALQIRVVLNWFEELKQRAPGR